MIGSAPSSSGDAISGYARSLGEVEAVSLRARPSFKPRDVCLQDVGFLERSDVVSSSKELVDVVGEAADVARHNCERSRWDVFPIRRRIISGLHPHSMTRGLPLGTRLVLDSLASERVEGVHIPPSISAILILVVLLSKSGVSVV